jgi:hypothetical protein
VFGNGRIGSVVVLMAELLVVAVEIGCVKWLRVFGFERCGSIEVDMSAG